MPQILQQNNLEIDLNKWEKCNLKIIIIIKHIMICDNGYQSNLKYEFKN